MLPTREVPPKAAEKPSPPQKRKLATRWLFIILSVSLLFTTRWVTTASGSSAPSLDYFQANPSITPTATATIASASEPAATETPVPYSASGTMIKVSGYAVNLRTGPGINFEVIRKLAFDETLVLSGRLSDNSWLYVKASDGQEGWVQAMWADIAGIELDDYPIQTPSPPKTTIKVTGGVVNLRTGPSTKYEVVRKLTLGESMDLLGRLGDNSWLYVQAADGQEGWIQTAWVDLGGIKFDNEYHPVQTPPPTPTSTLVVLEGIEGHWIDIDLSQQMLYAYDGTDLVASFLVSTGIKIYPTEIGQYKIYVKMEYSDMRGNDFFLPDVPFTMYYSGDFSIHGTYWHHNFGTPMSHGCINMDISDAEWVYNWASVGTLVNIHY